MPKEYKVYGWIKILVSNLTIFILLLVIGEISIRIFNPNYDVYVRTYPGQYKDRFFYENTTTVNWPKKDDFLGWVCNNKTKSLKFSDKIYNKLSIVYNINEQGFRYRANLITDSASEGNIVMLGDSFLFGVYLKENEILTSLLEKEFNDNYKFINLGVPGYGIDQMYLSYVKLSKTFKPKMVILFYIDDDIYRTYEAFRFTEGMNKPSFEIKKGGLVKRTNDRPSIIEKIFQHSHLLNPFYKKYAHLQSKDISYKIFEKLIQNTQMFNQALLIIRCPTDYQLLNNDSFSSLSFEKMLFNDDVIYYELFDDLRKFGNKKIKMMYLANDGHLSSYGIKIVSELIYRKIKEIGIIPK